MSDEAKDQIESALEGMSEEELRKVAADFVENKIFTNFHMHAHDLRVGSTMIGLVFLPIFFGAAASMSNAWMVYEYYDEALPRSVNGYPIFMSVRKIIRKDAPAFQHYVEEYKKMKAKFFAAPVPKEIKPNG